MISRAATIVFFLSFGLAFFVVPAFFGLVAAISAIVAGVALIAGI